MVLSVTRIHLRSLRFLPAFFVYSLRSTRQAQRAPGFRAGWVGTEFPLAFWTATAWDSADAMMRFRNSEPHLYAMPKLRHWCDEASYTHWDDGAAAAPSAEVALQRLTTGGKLSKVNAPSSRQQAGRATADTAPTIGRRLPPVGRRRAGAPTM